MTEPKRKIRITRPQDIRRLLAQMINDVRLDDEISTERKAQLIATLSNSALRSIEQGDMADRLDQYERELAEYKDLIEQMKRKGRHR